MDRARTGDGRAVLIAGEAGIGKTAFLRRFAELVRAGGDTYLAGECVEVEARRPFGPFVQVLAAAEQKVPAVVHRTLTGDGRALARLLPGSQGDEGAAATHSSERYRIHESFVGLFRELARVRPLVVAIDDLQWADEATLELIPYLATRLRDERVLLLGTYRSDELHRLHPLKTAFTQLERGRLTERVELHALDRAGTSAVIQGALGLDEPPLKQLVAAIDERCEGNPFFIEEMLKTLVERGAVVPRENVWRPERLAAATAIPDSVRDVVEQRMSRMDPVARHVVQVAAVIGPTFDFDLLKAVSGADDEALLLALRGAIDGQLVTEASGGDRYRFRHALTREAVLGELQQRERRLLHRRIGDAIRSRAGGDEGPWAEDLADHFDQSGDTDEARRYHDLAAVEAKRSFAFSRELRHLERAVELTTDEGAVLAELQLRLSTAATMSAELRRASRAADEAVRLFEAAGDHARAGVALLAAGGIQFYLGDPNAEVANQRAIALLEPFGDSEALADAYAGLSGQAAIANDADGAVANAERALAIAVRANSVRAQALALFRLGGGLGLRGDDRSLARLREAFDLALRNELVYEAQEVCRNSIVQLENFGAPRAEALRWNDERLQQARRHGYRAADVIKDECIAAYGAGDWDRARALAREMPDESIWTGLTDVLVAVIVVARDGPDAGLPLIDGPLQRLRAADRPQWHIWGENAAAEIELLSGNEAACIRHADSLETLVIDDYWLYGISHAAICGIVAARRLNNQTALRRWIELALSEPKRPKAHHNLARRAMAHAETAAELGDLDVAATKLAECAAHLAEGILAPAGFLPVTFVRLRRAELLLQRNAPGDRAEAARELAADVPYLRRARATWYLGRLQAWGSAHNVPFPAEERTPVATGSTSQLTAREHEVAVLVARGLTNRAIADKLVISERTAEGHVEQVRNKLGFHSRSQIAAWVTETMPRSVSPR